MVYVIEIRGRKYRYATLADAEKIRKQIFERSGVIVGISLEPGRVRRK